LSTIISRWRIGIRRRFPPWRYNVQLVKAGIDYKFESGISEATASTSRGYSRDPSEDEDLAKKSQNPIADLISVPFQSNTNFNAGPFNRTQEVLNIQPVVPLHISADWNLIARTIVPVISQPNPILDSNTNGIGDITEELFFSPVHSGALIWGAGPVFTIPSATDPILGTGRVLLGPTAVFLTTPGHWVIGVLLNNQWSVGGNPLLPSVNTFLAQPFINYNMAHGWYLTSSPLITANWLAAPGQQWVVPVGGGFGRIFKIGDQPVSANIAAYYNVVHPTASPNWHCAPNSRFCSQRSSRRLIPSKRFVASLVAAFAIVAGASAESYAQTGKVRLNIVKSGSVVGQGGGTGTLTYYGKRYRLSAGRIGLLGVASELSA
jgi:hypothetical protein